MKKLPVVAGITFLLTFLGLFIYFYRSSGKFRKSIIAAFVAVSFYFSSLKPAHSAGQADAFTPQNQQHQSRPQKEGIFSRKSNNGGPGPEKPNGDGSSGDDGGIPNYPQSESVEETQKRVEWMQEQVRELEEETDSESEIETESEEDQCDQQNKAGINELPDSSKFIYNLETKTAKKAVKNVWKNPQARKEIISNLDKIDRGELLPRNEKDFKGFKTLKELKFTKTRMLVRPGKNGKPDEIIAIFLRRDLDDVAKKLKNKFD